MHVAQSRGPKPARKTDPRLGWKLREANPPHQLSRTVTDSQNCRSMRANSGKAGDVKFGLLLFASLR